jgi:hypothetical protein
VKKQVEVCGTMSDGTNLLNITYEGVHNHSIGLDPSELAAMVNIYLIIIIYHSYHSSFCLYFLIIAEKA